MSYTKQTAIKIYYEERGEGPPVLFISGSGADLRVKPNVLDGPLARAFRTIAYDQRGLGQTERPDEPYSMADYADDAAALLDELGLAKVDVVGVSFGGMVALHFALRHPERIGKLVLCCTSPGGDLPSFPFHELDERMTAGERVKALMGVSDLRRDEAWQAANPKTVQQIIEATGAAALPEHQAPEAVMGSRRQLLARKDHDVAARLPEINLPTLICAGRHDGIAPVENQVALEKAISNSRLEWFEGGHLFLLQDKSAWPAIVSFLLGSAG